MTIKVLGLNDPEADPRGFDFGSGSDSLLKKIFLLCVQIATVVIEQINKIN